MHATPNPFCTRALFALLVVFLMPLPAGAQVLAAAPLAPPVNAHETAPSTEARPARPSDKPGSRDADLDFAVLMNKKYLNLDLWDFGLKRAVTTSGSP